MDLPGIEFCSVNMYILYMSIYYMGIYLYIHILICIYILFFNTYLMYCFNLQKLWTRKFGRFCLALQ